MKINKTMCTGVAILALTVGMGLSSLAQSITYKVQYGDSYYSIANNYGISVTSLMNANGAASAALNAGQTISVPLNEGKLTHTAVSGDSYWSLSQYYGVGLQALLDANGANANSRLYIGQKVTVPLGGVYYAKSGDTYYKISIKCGVSLRSLLSYNGVGETSVLYIGQAVRIPPQGGSASTGGTSTGGASQEAYVTYTTHTVKSGDTLWNIADKYGIPQTELASVNGLSSSSVLYVGQTLKIPVHHIPVKATPGAQYGEYLDWWSEAQYVLPVGSTFEVVDVYTGKSFWAKRTTGANHADIETLTAADTQKMKEIFGGSFTWNSRPVLIQYNGRKLAASLAGMPHAGNDAAAGGVNTSWRSGDYGAGTNFDWVKGNSMDGVIDLHFKNSTRHSDGKVDQYHAANVKIAAGVNE